VSDAVPLDDLPDELRKYAGQLVPDDDLPEVYKPPVIPRRLVPGNINLQNRPHVDNGDGTFSSVLSKSFEIDGREVLIPTISDDGKHMTDEQALDQYRRTGRHLGQFNTPDAADAFAQLLHEQQARQFGDMPSVAEPQRGRRVSAPLAAPKPFDPYGGYFSTNRPAPAQDPQSFGAALDDRARELLVDPLVRGWRQTAQASNVLTAASGIEDLPSAAHDIATREAEMRGMPVADYMQDVQRRIDALTPSDLSAEDFNNNNDPGTSRRKRNAAELAAWEEQQRQPHPFDPYGGYFSPGHGMPPAPQRAPTATVPQVIGEYLKDPRAAANIALESGSASLASILGGAGGGAAAGAAGGNPLTVAAGTALGAGSGSFLVEYSNDMLDTFRKNHVDLSNEAEVLAAFNNPVLMAQAREHALERGAGVALFDALSAGIAGRTEGIVEHAVARTGRVGAQAAPLIGKATEVGIQGGLGGAGEATGATFAGDKVDPVAVAQEVVGELGPGSAEILYGGAQHQAAQARAQAAGAAGPSAIPPGVQPGAPPGAGPPPAGGERRFSDPFALRMPTPEDLAAVQAEATQKRVEPYISDPFTGDLPLWGDNPMRDPNIQPELPLGTMPPPGSTGSPIPPQVGPQGSAPTPAPLTGTATQPAETPAAPRQLSTAFEPQAAPVPVAPPAPPAPHEPAPVSAPQTAPAVSTAQEPPAGGATPQIVQAPDTRLAASIPAAVAALSDPAKYTQVETEKGPIRLVNVRDDTHDGVIHAFDDKGKAVGSMFYSTKPGEQPHAAVAPEWQRQGVASAMYDLAEKTGAHIPAAVAEGQARTPEGQAFREGREKKSAPTPTQPAAEQPAPTAAPAPATPQTSATIPTLEEQANELDHAADTAEKEGDHDQAKSLRRYADELRGRGARKAKTATPPAAAPAKPAKAQQAPAQQSQLFGESGQPTPEAEVKPAAQEPAKAAKPPKAKKQAKKAADFSPDEMTGLDENIGTKAAEDTGAQDTTPEDQPAEPDTSGDQTLGEHAADELLGTTRQPTKGTTPATATPGQGKSLATIAARKAEEMRAAKARDTTPPLAPKRDQVIGRSNFDTMWRDLFASHDPGSVTPESAERREELVRRIQNAPMKQQTRLARRKMKNHFAFKDVVIDSKMSPREALDAMLDAYNNLHTMAGVMGFPRQAMGFNDQLTLTLKHTLGNKGTRGMFSFNFAKGFDNSVLALARQADSFTHEWIHALDLGLLMRHFKTRTLGVSGLSDFTRNPLAALPEEIRKPFTKLMGSLFFVDEKSANRMVQIAAETEIKRVELQEATDRLKRTQEIVTAKAERIKRAEAHEETAKREKDKFRAGSAASSARTMRARTAQAEAELLDHREAVEKLKKEIKALNDEAKSLLTTKASALLKGSEMVDSMHGDVYFSLPAEMLARAGEAWMANRIGQQVGVEFLSGSPEFYNENSSELMRLVYPDDTEREGIFQKFDDLFSALSDEQYFSGDTVAAKIPRDTMFSKELYQASLGDPDLAYWRRIYEAGKRDFVNAYISLKNIRVKSTSQQTIEAMRESSGALKRAAMGSYFTVTGGAQTMIAAYKNQPHVQQLLRKLYAKIATNPGRQTEVQPQIAEEEINKQMKLGLSTKDRIVKAYKLDINNEKQMAQLFEEYARPTEQVRADMQEHLDFLKQHVADIAGDRNKAGEKKSYETYIKALEDSLAQTPLPDRPDKPIQKAALEFRKLSDRIYKDNREAGINLGYVSNYMQRNLDIDKIEADEPGFLKQATLAYQAKAMLDKQKLERTAARLNDLVKAGESAARRGIKQTPAMRKAWTGLQAVNAKLADINELTLDDFERQAEEYLHSILMPGLYMPEKNTPRNKYTKSRTLPPAADVLMKDFYVQNVVASTEAQIAQSAYRVAYAKRFGHENEELKALSEELVAAGLDRNDLPTIYDQIKVAFGMTGNFTSPADTVANWVLSLKTMGMLSLSGFANFFEPYNVSAVTRNPIDGFKALGVAYLPMLHMGKRKELKVAMEMLGLSASAINEQMIANRSGIEYGEQPFLLALRTGFGYASGVHPLTMTGNIGVTDVLMTYVHHLSTNVAEGSPEEMDTAFKVFNEFGVPEKDRLKFAEYVRSLPKGRPTMNHLLEAGDAHMKDLYGNMIGRMLRYSIQQSMRVDRARMSFDRVGRFVASLTNFTLFYQRNNLVRDAKLVAGAKSVTNKPLANTGAKLNQAARSVSMKAMLTGLTLLSMIAREFWNDSEEDRKRKKKLADYLAWQELLEAYDRSGQTGGTTTAVNWFMKYKYDREVSALAVGAVPSAILSDLDDMANGFLPTSRNSPDTNTNERKAWGAVYDNTVGLMSAPALVAMKMTGPVGWAVNSKIHSRGMKQAFANKMAPKTATELAAEADKAEKPVLTPAEQKEADAIKASEHAEKLQDAEQMYGPNSGYVPQTGNDVPEDDLPPPPPGDFPDETGAEGIP
jgi:GNAT superfamily N-acetyltransferase